MRIPIEEEIEGYRSGKALVRKYLNLNKMVKGRPSLVHTSWHLETADPELQGEKKTNSSLTDQALQANERLSSLGRAGCTVLLWRGLTQGKISAH